MIVHDDLFLFAALVHATVFKLFLNDLLYTQYFQVLADAIDLPCRIAKGCKYCKRDDASSCLVRFGLERYVLYC